MKHEKGEWTLTSVGNIHTLKVTDIEGSEQLWVTTEQLLSLKEFLNSLEFETQEPSTKI